MCLGAWSYLVLFPKVKKCGVKKSVIISMGCLLFVAALVLFREHISFADLSIYPFVFALMIVHGYSNIQIKQTSLFKYFEQISYPIYLVHYGICCYMKFAYDGLGYGWGLCVYIIVVLLAAHILFYIKFLLGRLYERQREGEEKRICK